MDLAVFDVDEVLKECEKRRLISETVCERHLAMNGTLHIKRFL